MFIIWLLFQHVVSAEDDVRIRYTCTKDIPGYFWDGFQCSKCASPVCFCNTYLGCDDCQKNFYLDSKSSKCERCPLGCDKCCRLQQITKLVCTQCAEDYSYISGVCYKMKGCVRFSVHGHCVECNELNGYFLNSISECEKCPVGCLTCRNEFYCPNCLPQYYKYSEYLKDDSKKYRTSFICKPCNTGGQQGCALCSIIDDKPGATRCQACGSGYFYHYNDEKCEKCSENCITCQDPTDLPKICTICSSGYLLADDKGNKVCHSCSQSIPNCMNCEIQETFLCNWCDNGYYLVPAENTCLPCRTKESIGVKLCDSPLIGAPSLTYRCIKNTNQCQISDQNGNCDTCEKGKTTQKLDDGLTTKCIDCHDVVQNCSDCATDQKQLFICLTCEKYYYLERNSKNYACKHCPENCLACDSSGCSQCKPNYINENKACVKCEENCFICKSQVGKVGTQCMECDKGYGLHDIHGCQLCQTGCYTCNYHRDTCTRCIDKFYLFNGACIAFPDNCLEANNLGFCFLCDTRSPPQPEIKFLEIDYDEFNDVLKIGEEGEESNNIHIGEEDGINIASEEEKGGGDENIINPDDGSPDENYFDLINEAVFYKSVNGYCLMCSNYLSGTFTCPNSCFDLTISDNYKQILQTIVSIATLLWFVT